jgi:hypothetical protein
LLVADQNIAPGQEVKKVPITPQIPPVLGFGSSGFKDDFLHGGVTHQVSGIRRQRSEVRKKQ